MATYSIKDLQKRWGVGEHTILGFIHSGALVGFSVGRKQLGQGRPKWRCTEEAVKNFEASRQATPPTPKPTRRRRSKQTDVVEFIK